MLLYQEFLERERVLLTRKLLNQKFILAKLKSSLVTAHIFYMSSFAQKLMQGNRSSSIVLRLWLVFHILISFETLLPNFASIFYENELHMYFILFWFDDSYARDWQLILVLIGQLKEIFARWTTCSFGNYTNDVCKLL